MSLPPKDTRGRYDWSGVTKSLKSSPGEWALVLKRQPRSLYRAIKSEHMTALQDPEWRFEVCTRENNTRENVCDYWMRAVPRQEEHDAPESQP